MSIQVADLFNVMACLSVTDGASDWCIGLSASRKLSYRLNGDWLFKPLINRFENSTPDWTFKALFKYPASLNLSEV